MTDIDETITTTPKSDASGRRAPVRHDRPRNRAESRHRRPSVPRPETAILRLRGTAEVDRGTVGPLRGRVNDGYPFDENLNTRFGSIQSETSGRRQTAPAARP